MPVLVALLKEMLSRPADVVTRAVPVRGVVRSSSAADQPPGSPGSLDAQSPEPDPQPSEIVEDRIAQHGEVSGSSKPWHRDGVRMAVVTGLLGFLVCAVIITVPELVAGKSAAGGDRGTTLFGGSPSSSREPSTTTTTTTTTETESPTPPADTVTVPPPAATVTVPPPAPVPVPPARTTPTEPETETAPVEPEPDVPEPVPPG